MQLSDSLYNTLRLFAKSGEVKISSGSLEELRTVCREKYRYSVDIKCKDCIGKYVKKLATDYGYLVD